ncbi:MOB kinase activator-like 2,MOB kinase activator-like 1 homolog B,MOB kinase activator 2 [Acanthosepion pharaonis]|uniref:MOB kinase activator-like 2,MOB kinase activator-like 1 homolog B,MOB kinase activator 2 n=1 Tax=Acanthosepion pharaonis TaxID=158019 RepID=A0A812CLM9_ACAPH|nr:MOB kinase activator-like 2,MOB kinase activator-like 1 homolog B,MOB kinase activator 2 [Sepia pharaonis]
MDWFMGKGRRKDKDSPTPLVQDEQRQYLQDSCVQERIIQADFEKIVEIPLCLDYCEWLATHVISFFNHVNLMYGAISEYCTSEGCSIMNGPGNVQYFWHDEKGKKFKCTAPEYVDYVMSFIQKDILEETVFPTKFGNAFPSTFQTVVKRIHRYLFHVLAHIYHAHYNEVYVLGLHGHLNTLFAHFMVFNLRFDLLEEKETDVLHDLIKALTTFVPTDTINPLTSTASGEETAADGTAMTNAPSPNPAANPIINPSNNELENEQMRT